MRYFEIDEIRDELLKNKINQKDINDAGNFVEDLALSFGIRAEEILDPAPFKIRMLAVNYALMTCAKNLSVMNLKGADGDDAYALKYKIYAKEVERLEGQICADTFTGGRPLKKRTFPVAVPLYRR